MSGANGVGSTVALSGPQRTLRIQCVDDDGREVPINAREYMTAISAAWAAAAATVLLEELRCAALPDAIARETFRGIIEYAQQEFARTLRKQAWDVPAVRSIFPRAPRPQIPLYETVESRAVRDSAGRLEGMVTTKRRTDKPNGDGFGFLAR